MNIAQCKLTLSQRKRLDILAAARAECLDAGFRDTSMDRIAESAQVSKRTVYNHFPSKEALFMAIAAQFMEELRQAINVAYSSDRSLDDQLTEIANREISQVTQPDYIAMFRVFIAELGTFRDAFDDLLKDWNGSVDPLECWVEAASNDGRLTVKNSALAAAQFYSLLKGSLFWPVLAGYRSSPPEHERDAVISEAVTMFLARYESS